MSYALKSRSRMPPQGWVFRQPETGWENKLPMSTNFADTVSAIVAMRRNNPRHGLSTNPATVEAELEAFTCARLNGDDQWCVEQDAELLKKKATQFTEHGLGMPLSPPPDPGVVARLVEAVKRTADGGRILADWLGDGGQPVDYDTAANRASVCTECPKNVQADWSGKITGAVAAAVLEQRRIKTQLDLVLPHEEELGTCDVCLCDLKLKPWTPLRHIVAHTSERVWSELPEWCWMRVEAGR